MNTAGWKGPWATPPSSGESPRGTLIPRGRMSPPSRVRPQGAEVSTVKQVKDLFTPEGMGSALSPLCCVPQHRLGQTDKHSWNTTSTTYYRITLRTSTQTTARTPKHARAVSGGGREEAAEPNYPPPPPQKPFLGIASGHRPGIAGRNRRSQGIARSRCNEPQLCIWLLVHYTHAGHLAITRECVPRLCEMMWQV